MMKKEQLKVAPFLVNRLEIILNALNLLILRYHQVEVQR